MMPPSPVEIGETVSLSVAASDPDPGDAVAVVRFYEDLDGDGAADPNELLGEDTTPSDGWSFDWDTKSHPTGVTTLLAVAEDSGKDVSAARPLTATLTAPIPNRAPSVESFAGSPSDPVVGDTVTLTVSASDPDANDSVAAVRLYDDQNGNGEADADEAIGEASLAASTWTFEWDTKQHDAGPTTLLAVAEDTDKAQSSPWPLQLTLADPPVNNAPQIDTFVADSDNVTVGDLVELSVTASDPDTGDSVAAVLFYEDRNGDGQGAADEAIGTDTDATDGWGLKWDTGLASAGRVSLLTVAEDVEKATSDPRQVEVTLVDPVVDHAPTLDALTARPASPILIGQTVTLSASATDPDPGDQVTQVDFYLDSDQDGIGQPDEMLRTDTDGSDGWTGEWGTSGYAVSTATLLAVAQDRGGNRSQPRSVTVDLTGTPPVQEITLDASHTTATYTDSDGDLVTVQIQISNDGSVVIRRLAVDWGRPADALAIVWQGTDARTSLSVHVNETGTDPDDGTSIQHIFGTGIGTLHMPDVAVVGSLEIAGDLGTVTVDDVHDVEVQGDVGRMTVHGEALGDMDVGGNLNRLDLHGGLSADGSIDVTGDLGRQYLIRRRGRRRWVTEGLWSGGNVEGAVSVGGTAYQINVDGEIDAPMTINRDANRIVANGIEGSLTVHGNVGALESRGQIQAAVNVDGDLWRLDAHQGTSADGDITVGGDLGRQYRIRRRGRRRWVTEGLTSGGDLQGDVSVNGTAQKIDVDGRIAGRINIGRDAGRIVANGVEGAITVHGNVGHLESLGQIQAAVNVDGDLWRLDAHQGTSADGNITVGGDLGRQYRIRRRGRRRWVTEGLWSGSHVQGDITVAGHAWKIDIDGDLVDASINRDRGSAGTLESVTVSGRIRSSSPEWVRSSVGPFLISDSTWSGYLAAGDSHVFGGTVTAEAVRA